MTESAEDVAFDVYSALELCEKKMPAYPIFGLLRNIQQGRGSNFRGGRNIIERESGILLISLRHKVISVLRASAAFFPLLQNWPTKRGIHIFVTIFGRRQFSPLAEIFPLVFFAHTRQFLREGEMGLAFVITPGKESRSILCLRKRRR